MPKPVDLGSRVKLMFLTRTGSVLGAAEMLRPVSKSLQPFRFVALEADDQRRLRMAVQSSLKLGTSGLYPDQVEGNREQQWMEKYRAALVDRQPRRGRLFRTVLAAAVTLATLCLGSVVYIFSIHLK